MVTVKTTAQQQAANAAAYAPGILLGTVDAMAMFWQCYCDITAMFWLRKRIWSWLVEAVGKVSAQGPANVLDIWDHAIGFYQCFYIYCICFEKLSSRIN